MRIGCLNKVVFLLVSQCQLTLPPTYASALSTVSVGLGFCRTAGKQSPSRNRLPKLRGNLLRFSKNTEVFPLRHHL